MKSQQKKHRATVDTLIARSPETCFEAMTDFGSYPHWQTAVQEADVLDANPEAPVVRYRINALVRHIEYTLRYRIDRDNLRFTWEYLEGDIADTVGHFQVEAISPADFLDKENHIHSLFYRHHDPYSIHSDSELSRAEYHIDLDPGFWIPGPLANMVRNLVMTGVLKDLRKRVERDNRQQTA